jgi:PKD repeat protein
MSFTYLRRAAVALTLLSTAACTVKSTQEPSLAGPSGLALSLNVNAVPDSINQDGGSQSSLKVRAIGPDGRGMASLPLRLDMFVAGAPQDYGTLSARTVVTNSEGIATAVYTAPPGPVNGSFGICGGLPGNCVAIVATATGNDFRNANPEQVLIRLVPTGVILPPAGAPTASFTYTPSPVSVNVPTIFDASGSTVGTGASAITSYSWSWGDGTPNSTGRSSTHTFLTGNSFNVTLTVTNDRGASNSSSQSITVGSSDPFTGDWTSSPPVSTGAVVGQLVNFNADQVQTSAGHQVTAFNWNFGDNDSSQPSTGFQVSHQFGTAGIYSVVLSVADDLGRKKVFAAKTITVTAGNPTVDLKLFKSGSNVIRADGSGSSASGGSTIVSYRFIWGDGSADTVGLASSATHDFGAAPGGAGAHTVTLVVTDSAGRTNSSQSTVTTP